MLEQRKDWKVKANIMQAIVDCKNSFGEGCSLMEGLYEKLAEAYTKIGYNEEAVTSLLKHIELAET